jgi:hypothetical protein
MVAADRRQAETQSSASFLCGVVFAVGFFLWNWLVQHGAADGAAAGAIGGGFLPALMARLDLRKRGRLSGQRDLERWRAWRNRTQIQSGDHVDR